ncbi:uncharacterized protein LOC111628700 [Centruroides sculpturatus]|uniref:uncharacterized protein LOC111628700 n=1 Tax=Centruroides sculpturatus TaxID=218467 RepID=UPI000C6E4E04|nr:uncharacterized protein LOC111628700 [Centruroides sculpturatus]
MYEGAETQIKSNVGTTEVFFVNVDLHQGSALSPYLLDAIMDLLVRDVKCEAPWSMLFADDIVPCELFQTKAEKKREDWKKVLEERGMKIGRTKTAYMILNGRTSVILKSKMCRSLWFRVLNILGHLSRWEEDWSRRCSIEFNVDDELEEAERCVMRQES